MSVCVSSPQPSPLQTKKLQLSQPFLIDKLAKLLHKILYHSEMILLQIVLF